MRIKRDTNLEHKQPICTVILFCFLYYLASTPEPISEIAPTIQQMVQELLELLYAFFLKKITNGQESYLLYQDSIYSFRGQSMKIYMHPTISIVTPHAPHQEQA